MAVSMVKQEFDLAKRERLTRISKAWDRYYGRHPDVFRPSKTDPRGEDNVKVNLCREIVDTSAFFLFGNGFDLEVDGEAESEHEEWIEKCFDFNGFDVLSLDWATNGGVTGDAFLKVSPAEPGSAFPSITVLDSANVDADWEPDNYLKVRRYVISWKGVDRGRAMAYKQEISLDEGGQSWTIADYVSPEKLQVYTLVNSVRWNFPWCPVFHTKNLPAPNCFWGRADLEDDVMGTNQDVNFLWSTMKRILRIHAHPKLIGKGFNAKDLDLSVDTITMLNKPEADIKLLEMQGDLTATLETIRELKAVFHETTNVPEIAAGKVDNAGQLSGLALQLLYGPLLRLTKTKQLLYGATLRELGKRLIELGNRVQVDTVTVQFPNPLPVNKLEEAQTGVVLKDVGVSTERVLTDLGYDATAEMEKRAEEAKQSQTAAQTAFDRGNAGGDPYSTGGRAE